MPAIDPSTIPSATQQIDPIQSVSDITTPCIVTQFTIPSTTLLTTNSTPQESKITEREVVELHNKLNELSELSNIQIAGVIIAGIFIAAAVTLALVFTSGTDPISIIMYCGMSLGLGFGASYGLFYLLKEANSQARADLVKKICESPELVQELTKLQFQDLLEIKSLESLEKGKSEVESKLKQQARKIKEQYESLQKNQGSILPGSLEQLQKMVDTIASELLLFSHKLACHLKNLHAKKFSTRDVECIRDIKQSYFSLQAKIHSASQICPSSCAPKTHL